jgi:AbrB family looped-hinge helix DNA binding protein
MQREARITSKGQITVPKAVRNALGLKPGDKVVFEQEGEEICVRPVRAQSMFARYRGIGNTGLASGRKAVLRKIRELRGHDAEHK